MYFPSGNVFISNQTSLQSSINLRSWTQEKRIFKHAEPRASEFGYVFAGYSDVWDVGHMIYVEKKN
jgi:hypothetical protein